MVHGGGDIGRLSGTQSQHNGRQVTEDMALHTITRPSSNTFCLYHSHTVQSKISASGHPTESVTYTQIIKFLLHVVYLSTEIIQKKLFLFSEHIKLRMMWVTLQVVPCKCNSNLANVSSRCRHFKLKLTLI